MNAYYLSCQCESFSHHVSTLDGASAGVNPADFVPHRDPHLLVNLHEPGRLPLLAQAQTLQLLGQHLQRQVSLDAIRPVQTVEAVGPHDPLLLRERLVVLGKVEPKDFHGLPQPFPELGQVFEVPAPALGVVVKEDVGKLGVVAARPVVALEHLRQGRLALLAPEHRGPEEVDDDEAAVVSLHLAHVLVKGRGGGLGAAGEADLVRADLDAGLFPEERNGAADLDEGGSLVVREDDLLRFYEVRHLDKKSSFEHH